MGRLKTLVETFDSFKKVLSSI